MLHYLSLVTTSCHGKFSQTDGLFLMCNTVHINVDIIMYYTVVTLDVEFNIPVDELQVLVYALNQDHQVMCAITSKIVKMYCMTYIPELPELVNI
jgi:hypothetical protein